MISTTKKIQKFFSHYPALTYKKGERFVLSGQIVHQASYIKSGIARVYAVDKNGEEVTTMFINSDKNPDMVWGMTNSFVSTRNIEAYTNVEVVQSPKEEFTEFLLKNFDVQLAILQSYSKNLSAVQNQILYVRSGNAIQKLGGALLYLGEELGHEEKKRIVIPLSISHQFLSTLTGLTRETITTQVKKLKELGIIEYSHKEIVIKDTDALCHTA